MITIKKFLLTPYQCNYLILPEITLQGDTMEKTNVIERYTCIDGRIIGQSF